MKRARLALAALLASVAGVLMGRAVRLAGPCAVAPEPEPAAILVPAEALSLRHVLLACGEELPSVPIGLRLAYLLASDQPLVGGARC